jgi:hypothetical protein
MNASFPGRLALSLVLVLLAACSAPGGASEPAATEEPSMSDAEASPSFRLTTPKPSAPSSLGGTELVGALGFDDIEGGCTFLEANGVRYEVIYPDGWQLQRSPLQLISPEGEVVAGPGDQVTVRGEEAGDMASICQIGPIFRATEVIVP